MGKANILTVEGLVIESVEDGNTSRKIVALLKDIGRTPICAKGARSSKSPIFAITNTLTYNEYVLYKAPNYYAINGGHVKKNFYNISKNIKKLAEANYMLELTNRICVNGVEENEILKLLYVALIYLEKLPDDNDFGNSHENSDKIRLIARIYELKILEISGFIGCNTCYYCNADLGYNRENHKNYYYNENKAEFNCGGHDNQSYRVNQGVVEAMEYCFNSDIKKLFSFSISHENLLQFDRILKNYIEMHLDLKLESRKFFFSL